MRTPTKACAILLIACLAGLAAACVATLDPQKDAATQAVFDQVKHRQFAAVEARLPQRLRTAVTDTRLQVEAGLIPDQPPEAVKLIGFNTAASPGGPSSGSWDVVVTREYLYSDRLLVVTTAIREQAGKAPQILAFNVQPFPRAALSIGRFGLAHKSPTQYLFLGLATLIPLLLITALAVLARDRTTKWKWAWTLFILVGFTRLSVNWVSGAILFQPLAFVLLGASVNRAQLDVAPWIVSISLPLGALTYLGRAWFSAPPDEVA